MNRSQFMTADQKARWSFAERQAGHKLPRTHENCTRILGVARPGKTAKDKGRGEQPLLLYKHYARLAEGISTVFTWQIHWFDSNTEYQTTCV